MKDGIKGLRKSFAGRTPIRGGILFAIRNPDIDHTGSAQDASEGRSNIAGAYSMFDPESSYVLVSMRERIAIGGFRMGEEGGIEIQADVKLFCPSEPPVKMVRLDLVPIDASSTE